MNSTFASLGYRNYRIWFFAGLIANVGTWMQRIAQDWLVQTELTNHSTVQVGIVTALQFLPVLFLSAYAGVLADRLSRRKILICTQSSMALLAAGLGALQVTGTVHLWHVYLFALALGAASAIDGPARQTFVAEMVPAENLANAVGLNSASFNAARLIGPGLAGLLIAWVGTGPVFFINGLSFGATILAMLTLNGALLHPLERAPREKGMLREGLRYVRRRSDIKVILIVSAVVSALGLNFQLTSIAMATQEFGRGSGEFGLASSVMAIGSVCGALLAARRERPRVRLVLGAALAFGICDAVMALMPTYWSYVASSILVGLCSLTFITAANTAIQISTAPQMRGRVISIYQMVFLGVTPPGSILVGWVAQQYGARWAIGIGAIAAGLAATIAIIWTSRRWHLRIAYRHSLHPRLQIVQNDVPKIGYEDGVLAGEADSAPPSKRSLDNDDTEVA